MALSEDELAAIEGPARRLTVADLKKRALASKQSGNKADALRYLKQAKQIEREDENDRGGGGDASEEPPYASTLPLFWKKVAILCKQAGDLDRAKEALLHSKELELQGEEGELPPSAITRADEPPPPAISEHTAAASAVRAKKSGGATKPNQETTPKPQHDSPVNSNDVETLVCLGFSQDQAREALLSCGGDAEAAVNRLLSQQSAAATTKHQPPSPPPEPKENAAAFTESDVETLECLGFAKEQAREALLACGGDAEAAVNRLLSQQASTTDQPPSPPPATPPPPRSSNIGNTSRNSTVGGDGNGEDGQEKAVTNTAGGGDSNRGGAEHNTTANKDITESNDSNHDDADDYLACERGSSSNIGVSFTDEELMDEEAMVEFASLGNVKGIPTQEEYAAKALQYKKLALKYKNEDKDLKKAALHLKKAKQLEKVALALKNLGGIGGGDDENDTLTMDSLSPEERELLSELFATPAPAISTAGTDENARIVGSSSAGNNNPDGMITLDDLDDIEEDDDIIEMILMMGVGDPKSALPSAEGLEAEVAKEKQKAVSFKQAGDIEAAKRALLKSKKINVQAARVARICLKLDEKKRKEEGGDNSNDDDDDQKQPVTMEALESLMTGESSHKIQSPTTVEDPKPKPTPPANPWLSRPSSEIKAEVVRLKNEKRVPEATELLPVLKQKVAQERAELERKKRDGMRALLRDGLNACEEQIVKWQYYRWFVGAAKESASDEVVLGRRQYEEWTGFGRDCQRAMRLVNTKGSSSVNVIPENDGSSIESNNTAKNDGGSKRKRKLYALKDDVVSLVELCTMNPENGNNDSNNGVESTEGGATADAVIEIAIMGMYNMEENEKLQKILLKQQQQKAGGSKSKKLAPPDRCPNLTASAKLQLPIDINDPSKAAHEEDMEPSNSTLSSSGVPDSPPSSSSPWLAFEYEFDSTSDSSRRRIRLPRRDRKQERTLLRRMETKTAQFSVFYSHDQRTREEKDAARKAAEEAEAAKKKSWFWGNNIKEQDGSADANGTCSKGNSNEKDSFLGKVTIELGQLLSRGCIADDFPIMTNGKPLGGTLRVCLRTIPVSLDPDRYEGVPLPVGDGSSPKSPSIVPYQNGLAFAFKCGEVDGKNNGGGEEKN